MRSTPPIAEGEVLREGRRILRKLSAGARLLPRSEGNYALTPCKGMRPGATIAGQLVAAFCRRGWLTAAESDGGLVLSDAGLGWLRRTLASENGFAAQHQLRTRRSISDEHGNERLVTINEGEAPLGWLHRRRGADGKPLISRFQFEAGERLRHDFTIAQLTPRLGVDFSAPVIGGRRGAKADAPLSETVLAAKQRVSRALAAVGPGLADLLLDVCCHLIGLETAEREKGWPQRSAKVVLQIALDRLAAHYGLGPAIGAPSRLRAWHAPEEKEEA